jgi:hypothetical protein
MRRMGVKQELQKLKEPDIWGFMLFALYKTRDIPEFSSISELAYILDKPNFLRLCEYFGGCTIKIPTVEEIELMLYGLLFYQYIEIDKMNVNDAMVLMQNSNYSKKEIKNSYNKVKELLTNYELSTRTTI